MKVRKKECWFSKNEMTAQVPKTDLYLEEYEYIQESLLEKNA